MKIAEIPGSLAIVKLDDRHYQLTDLSKPSIGLCLGVFPTDGAARSFAARIASIRALGALKSGSTRTQSEVVNSDGLERVPHPISNGATARNSGEHSEPAWKSIH